MVPGLPRDPQCRQGSRLATTTSAARSSAAGVTRPQLARKVDVIPEMGHGQTNAHLGQVRYPTTPRARDASDPHEDITPAERPPTV